MAAAGPTIVKSLTSWTGSLFVVSPTEARSRKSTDVNEGEWVCANGQTVKTVFLPGSWLRSVTLEAPPSSDLHRSDCAPART